MQSPRIASPRRAGDGCGALDHIGIAYRPFIGLLRPHRAADDQRQALEAELFREKSMLCAHVITDAPSGKFPIPDGAGVLCGEVERPFPI